MENLVLAVHLIVALGIIGLIMLQQGKGAEMGASFGAGASQTLFGSSGSGNFFSRMTAILAAVFFVTSFTLAMLAKERTGDLDDLIPEASEESSVQLEGEAGELEELPVVTEVSETADSEGDLPALEETIEEAVDAELEAAPVSEESN